MGHIFDNLLVGADHGVGRWYVADEFESDQPAQFGKARSQGEDGILGCQRFIRNSKPDNDGPGLHVDRGPAWIDYVAG